VPHKLLTFARIAVILISLGLIAFLLSQGQMSLRIQVIVLAALGYYAVRLWVMGSRARRAQAASRRDGAAASPPASAEREPTAPTADDEVASARRETEEPRTDDTP
jgi:hypothetical protein